MAKKTEENVSETVVVAKSLNVHQRINAVMQEGSYVQKKGKNSFHGYKYAREADYIELIRPLLVKHGLTVATQLTHFSNEPMPDSGGNMLTKAVIKFTITNMDDPTQVVSYDIPSQGTDKGDKGVYKCLTGAKKYFLALAFMIETGDDAEEDSPEISNTQKLNVSSNSGTSNVTDIPRSTPFKKKQVVAEQPAVAAGGAQNGSAKSNLWD